MNPRQIIKVCALLFALVGVFVIKDYLAKPNLNNFFETLSYPTKSGSVVASSSAAAISSPRENFQADQKLNMWLTQLPSSTLIIDKIANVIYEKDANKNIAVLKLLLETDPQNSLLNYLLIQNCLLAVDANMCTADAMTVLKTFNADNGVVRDLEFLYTYRKGDFSAALTALNEANHSPYTTDFSYEKFAVLAQSMEKFGINRDLHMFVSLEGTLAAGVANHLNAVAGICKEKQAQREWKEACLARGQSLAERGRDSYSKLMGMQLIKVFGIVPDPRYQHIREQAEQEILQAQQLSMLVDGKAAEGWAPNDVQWQEFLTRYEAQGDTAAKAYLLSLMLLQ